MTPESWLEAHAYLRPVAELSAEVERAAAEIAVPEVPLPDWDDYRADFLAGVTLLQSTEAAVDLDPGGRMAAALIERLALARSSGWLAAEARALHAELQPDPHAARRITAGAARCRYCPGRVRASRMARAAPIAPAS